MNIHPKRKTVVRALAVAVVLLTVVSQASAWWPVNRHHPGRSSGTSIQSWLLMRGYSYHPQTLRSFSYEPVRFAAGDSAVVTVDKAGIMSGTTTLTTVAKGDQFVVGQVAGPWIAAKVEVDGKMVSGWIWCRHVSLDAPPGRTTKMADAAKQPVECRPYPDKPAYRTNRR